MAFLRYFNSLTEILIENSRTLVLTANFLASVIVIIADQKFQICQDHGSI